MNDHQDQDATSTTPTPPIQLGTSSLPPPVPGKSQSTGYGVKRWHSLVLLIFLGASLCLGALILVKDMPQPAPGVPAVQTIGDPVVGIVPLTRPIDASYADSVSKQITRLASNDRVKGILIEINSPGGTVAATQMIAATIENVRRETGKPIYSVSVDVCASGAYWLAVYTDSIYVLPGSVVGSIGVIRSGWSIQKLMETYGVKDQTITAGRYKDSGSMFRDMTGEERDIAQSQVNGIYSQFLDAVYSKRKDKGEPAITREVLECQLAEGRIFLGHDGVLFGLADKLGTSTDALNDMKKHLINTGKLRSDQELTRLEPPGESFLDRLTNIAGESSSSHLQQFLFGDKLSDATPKAETFMSRSGLHQLIEESWNLPLVVYLGPGVMP